jgi:hypothetical protein
MTLIGVPVAAGAADPPVVDPVVAAGPSPPFEELLHADATIATAATPITATESDLLLSQFRCARSSTFIPFDRV